jgi:excinuclease ABC subunit C
MDMLRQKLKNLPKSPGIYQFINKSGEVIYIGKAKNLRTRVGQYFQNHDKRPQLPFLMAEAADINYTVVSNELESTFLESTLIKKYLPKYNIMLRDDKNYAFIKIDYSTEIPQIGYARKIEKLYENEKLNLNEYNSKHPNIKRKLGARYFGPYSAAYKIRNTLNLVRKIFPYCAAQKVGSRPCFYYYMHRCPGVCIGKISLEEYSRHLDKIVKFLQGDIAGISKDIKIEMHAAAKNKKFETAARLRDQLKSLVLLAEKQSVILTRKVDWDIISLKLSDGYACINLFKVREGKLFDKENFVYELPASHLFNINNELKEYADAYKSEICQGFMEQYYMETSDAPKSVYVQFRLKDPLLIEQIIKLRFNLKPEILFPQKGKAKRLVNLGLANAEEYLKNWLSGRAGQLDKINAALAGLKEILNLVKIPQRIECFDISNIQGTNAVGSMVVFKDGLPAKSEYRKFKIYGKSTPDDFSMMKQMLSRRLARSIPDTDRQLSSDESDTNIKFANTKALALLWPLPDLIVIDGGKGQLNAALEVLQKSGSKSQIVSIPIIGLAKRIEEIFIPKQTDPIVLSHDNISLQLLQRLRDEAHRFGITFHRQLRSKQAVKSALDEIVDIGPKTKKLLKSKFGTIASIKQASLEELSEVVGGKLAKKIMGSL